MVEQQQGMDIEKEVDWYDCFIQYKASKQAEDILRDNNEELMDLFFYEFTE